MNPPEDELLPPPFAQANLYTFPLDPKSLIIEVGTHKGQWADLMATRYGCALYTFEPVPEFAQIAGRRLARFPFVVCSNFGLAATNRTETWQVKGDMTGSFNGEGPSVAVELICFAEWVRRCRITHIDLLALNCEGGEYELLEHILAAELLPEIKNILVQFHSLHPEHPERRRQISGALKKTHRLSFQDPIYWENWTRRIP